MAEDSHVIRGINWRETFPFTHLFRTFRIAIHPSKLLLALAALLSLYIGGRVLDAVWAPSQRAMPGEIAQYEQIVCDDRPDTMDLGAWRHQQRTRAIEGYARMLPMLADVKQGDEYKNLAKRDEAMKAAEAKLYTKDVKFRLGTLREESILKAFEDYRKAEKQDDAAVERRNRDVREINKGYGEAMSLIRTLEGRGLFISFFEYQTNRINAVVDAVRANNWFGKAGVMEGVIRFFTVGPAWLIGHHWLFFIIFTALFLVVWSTFGGAIARIAAVHVADEGRKLSIRQGLSFSISKFLSFLSAPLIPLMIVAAIGLALALAAGLLFWLRLNVVVGLLFFVALAASIVMTLVLLGTAGGFGLMYPTIAVEGSDSFDAISRSFSYVYAKPWRMLLYSLVAIIYGALTYLFVRLFIWLTLTLAHFFVGLWVFRDAAEGVSLWNTIFPAPTFSRLPYEVPTDLLTGYSAATAFFIAFWNYLLISLLGAFAISFYISANTIIYYLMRREVDATEMDDVYLEQPEEDFVETPTTPAPAEPAPITTATPPASEEPRPE